MASVAYATEAGLNPIWTHQLDPAALLLHAVISPIVVATIIFGWKAAELFIVRPNQGYTAPKWLLVRYVNRTLLVAWLLLAIAIGTQVMYAHAYGGLLESLNYSRMLRAGFQVGPNPLSFLRPFGGFAFIAAYLFFGAVLARQRRFASRIGLILATAASAYVMISWATRLVVATFLLTLVLITMQQVVRRPVRIILQGLLSLGATLVSVHFISIYFNVKASSSFIAFLARELSSPFASFAVRVQSHGADFRWFYDFIVAPIYLLPERVWLPLVENLDEIHTTLMVGVPKGVGGSTGGIPVDLITLGYWQAGILGILVVGFGVGLLLRNCQGFVDRIPIPFVGAVVLAVIVSQLVINGIFYAQPPVFMSNNITTFMTLSIIAYANVGYYKSSRRVHHSRHTPT